MYRTEQYNVIIEMHCTRGSKNTDTGGNSVNFISAHGRTLSYPTEM